MIDSNNDFSLQFDANENEDELDTELDFHIKPDFSRLHLISIILILVDRLILSANDIHLLIAKLKSFEDTGIFPDTILTAENAQNDDFWEKARELRNEVLRLEKEAEDKSSDSSNEAM